MESPGRPDPLEWAADSTGGSRVSKRVIAIAIALTFGVVSPVSADPMLHPSGGDDVPQIQAALDRGGIVRFGPGVYQLVRTTATWGGPAHLRILRSGVTIIGIGATLRSTTDTAMFAVGSDAQYDDVPVQPLAGPVFAHATRITLASGASSFAPGSYIYIRAGQTLGGLHQPDAEVNRVVSVKGQTLDLAWPTVKPYVNEQGAPFGVANVTDRTIINLSVRDLGFDHQGYAHTFIGGQVVGVRFLYSHGTFRGGFQSMGNYRFGEARGNTLNHVGAGPVTYTLTTAAGTSDVTWTDNVITGERVIQLHVHEGSANVTIRNNRITTGDSTTDENQISVRARAYNISILNNRLDGSPGSCALYVGTNTPGPGIISGNTILSHGGAAMCVDSPGWTVKNNVTPNAPNSLPYNP